jgi:hypothetical protein
MATRIPLSWLFLLVVLGVFAFFGYHIIQASQSSETPILPNIPSSKKSRSKPYNSETNSNVMSSTSDLEHTDNKRVKFNQEPDYMQNVPEHHQGDESEHTQAPVVPTRTAPNRMPTVPGQTEEDLRAPEPLQASPPATQYDIPEATDPLNKHVYMSSEFGSNFRHPEQMMERHPGIGMGNVVAAQIGSEQSGPGGNNAAGYAPEMAQNGGEFMTGISAFDVSESGVAYSML